MKSPARANKAFFFLLLIPFVGFAALGLIIGTDTLRDASFVGLCGVLYVFLVYYTRPILAPMNEVQTHARQHIS